MVDLYYSDEETLESHKQKIRENQQQPGGFDLWKANELGNFNESVPIPTLASPPSKEITNINQTESNTSIGSFDPFGEGFNTSNTSDQFTFSFDSFPETDGSQQDTFTFDENQMEENHDLHLFNKFVDLINNPCFSNVGKQVAELFHLENSNDNAEYAFQQIIGEAK